MDLEATMDDVDIIVVDMGSGTTKVGFSGEDAPRAVLSTVTATLNDILDEGREEEGVIAKRRSFVGEEAYKHSHSAEGGPNVLCHPCVRGCLDTSNKHSPSSTESIEQLYDHCFKSCLNVDPEEFGILILDSPTTPQSSREWLCELLFEKFKVKSVGMFNTAVMSLFSTGRTRGLVLESGAGVSHAVPVFEGYGIPHAIFKTEVAGQDITEELWRKCVEYKIPGIGDLEDSTKTLVMNSMKEKLCEVVLDYEAACSRPDPSDQEYRSFELPDGNIVQVPHAVRYAAGEVLFRGSQSLQAICTAALNTVDADFQSELTGTVVVSGGTSMIPGIVPRLQRELKHFNLHMNLDSQRRNAAWIGGSMFASFSTFEHFQILKSEYDEGKIDLKALVSRKTY